MCDADNLEPALALQRSASLPATRRGVRQSVDTACPDAPIFCGHLWKKSPGVNLLTQGYRWRYVVLLKGKMGWWASEKYALQEDAKGFVDFAVDSCDVFADDRSSATRFCVKPRTRRWSQAQAFTGANEGRTFVFDAEGSEHGRKSWLAAVSAHIDYGARKRRQSAARLSLVQLSHSGVSAAELKEAIKEGQAAGVEEAALKRASLVLNRVADHQKAVDSLLNPRAEDLSEASVKPNMLGAVDRDPGSEQAEGSSKEAALDTAEPAISTASCSSSRKDEQQRSVLEERSSLKDCQPGSSAASAFTVGQQVCIFGLRMAPELNGVEGSIIGWDEGEKRWKVRTLDGSGFLIRAANLEPIASTDPTGAIDNVSTFCKESTGPQQEYVNEGSLEIANNCLSRAEAQHQAVDAPLEEAREDAPVEETAHEGLSRPEAPHQTADVLPEESACQDPCRPEAQHQTAYAKPEEAMDDTLLEETAYEGLSRPEAEPCENKRFSGNGGDLDKCKIPSGMPKDLAALFMENQRMGLTNSFSQPKKSSGPTGFAYELHAPGPPLAKQAEKFDPADRLSRTAVVSSPTSGADSEAVLVPASVSETPPIPELPSAGSPDRSLQPAMETQQAAAGNANAADLPRREGRSRTRTEDSDDSELEEGISSRTRRSQHRSLPPPRRRHTQTFESAPVEMTESAPGEGSALWLELRAKLSKRRATVTSMETVF